MKKFLGIVSCLVLILVAGVTFAACGSSSPNITISSNVTELEIVLGSGEETKTVEFNVEGYGNGSGQLTFSVEEQELNTISCTPTYQGNGRTTLTITGKNRGTATITATSMQGSVSYVITVKVVQPITGLNQADEFKDKLYVISGSSLNLSQEKIWNYSPSNTNQRDLVFSFVGESQGCRIEDGNLVVDQDCGLSSVTIRAESAFNSSVYCEIPVTILSPIEVVAQTNGKTIVESVTDPNSQVSNFFEIFPRETEYQNSLTVTLIISAGNEKQALNVEAVFSSGEEKFAAPQTGYYFDRASQTHRYTFLIQANSQDAGKIDSLTFRVSYSGYAAGESDYSSDSIALNVSSYNKALQVDVNGQTGRVEIDVFESSINLVDGEILEISLLPGNLKQDQNYIILWAEDFENLPISLYKLDSTRRNYICVFGYDQNGNAVGSVENGIRYAKIQSGTKLYAFINNNYEGLTGTNKQSTIYAQAVEFWNSEISANERAFTTIDFVINPNAKDIFLAQPNDQGVLEADKDNKTIFIELGETEIAYIAVDPSTFTIGANSVVTIANESLAEIGKLVEHAVSEDYVFARFEIVANKVGSTTLTVTLSDGKQVDFNLVVISPLEELEMGLESVVVGETEIGSDIVPYRHLPDTTVIVGETAPFIALNKLSISNNGGAGIRLTKNATPETAQYYLGYHYYDYTFENGQDIKNITLEDIDVENIDFNTTSSIINTSLLANQTIIEAVNSSTEGAVLVRISVYAMGADGEYGDQPVGYFYYLIDFFIPTSGLTLSSGTLELYTYDTIGDKFLVNDVSASIGEISVTVNPVNQGLTPTYINNLKIYVNGNSVNIMEHFTNDVLYLYFDGSIASSRNNAALEIVRSFENNTFTFRFQALRREANYIFAMVLSEVDESKTFTALGRIIAKEAVEITDIEMINANEESPIYIENVFLTQDDFESEEAYLEYINDIIDNPYQLELIYNLYSSNGNEITNPSLEFEIDFNLISGEREYYTDINGNKVNYIQIIQENGKTYVRVERAAWDYSSYYALSEEEREQTSLEAHKVLVQFGANATISVYPTSNYYNSYNGWNGEEPIVYIPITVADGKTSETSLQLWDLDDLDLLRLYPAANFTIMANISMIQESSGSVSGVYQDYIPVEEFYGTLRGDPNFADGGSMPLIISISPLFKKIASDAVVENFSYIVTEAYSSEDIVIDNTKNVSMVNGETYLGGLANVNEGTIRNVAAIGEYMEDTSDLSTLSMFSGAQLYMSGQRVPASQIILLVGINSTYDNNALLVEMISQMDIRAGELVRYTGLLVGLNRGTIEITDTSTVDGIGAMAVFGANVGGIVGVNDTTGKIVGYNFYGNALGTESAGGIAALNRGEIKNCNVLNGGASLYGINVFVLGDNVYSYASEQDIDIQFASGGIVAISEGGKIQGCSAEFGTGTNPPDSSVGEGGIFEQLIEPELGSSVWGKRVAQAGTYTIKQQAEYDFNVSGRNSGSVITGTLEFFALSGGQFGGFENVVIQIPELSADSPSHYFEANGRNYRIYADYETNINYVYITIYDVTGEETTLRTINVYRNKGSQNIDGKFETLNSVDLVISSSPIYSGGLVGILSETKLSQSFFDGTLGVRDTNGGGLIGLLNESGQTEPLVENCYAVLGYNNSYVDRLSNSGYILRQGLFICSGSLNEIKYCYVSSNNSGFNPSYNGDGQATGSFHSAIRNSKLTSIFDILDYNDEFLGYDIEEWTDKTFVDLVNQYNYIEGSMNVTLGNSILSANSQIVGDRLYGSFELNVSLNNTDYGNGTLSLMLYKNGSQIETKTIEFRNFSAVGDSSIEYTFDDLGIKVVLTPEYLSSTSSRGINFVAMDVSSGETLYQSKISAWESTSTNNGVTNRTLRSSGNFGFRTVETTINHDGQSQVVSQNLYTYPSNSQSYEIYRFTYNGRIYTVNLSDSGSQSYNLEIKYLPYETATYGTTVLRKWVNVENSITQGQIQFTDSITVSANLNLFPDSINEQLNQNFTFTATFDGEEFVSEEQYELLPVFGGHTSYLVLEINSSGIMSLMVKTYKESSGGAYIDTLCSPSLENGSVVVNYGEDTKAFLELAEQGEILYSKISMEGMTTAFGPISLLYMKGFYLYLYDNYEILVADGTWEGVSYGDISGITGAEIKELICQLFGISSAQTDSEIKAQIKEIIDEKVIAPFNNSLNSIKTDLAALQTELNDFISELEGLLTAAGYESSEYSELLEKINSYSALISQANTAVSGISSISSGEDVKNLLLNAIEPVREVITGAYYDFIMFMESNGNKLEEYINNNFSSEEEVMEAMSGIYSFMIALEYDRYDIIEEDGGMTNELISGLAKLYAFDASAGYDTIPVDIDGFIDAGWDIANKDEESESIWIFEEGKLPYFRQNEETQRIYDFEIEVNPNKNQNSMINKDNSSVVLFYYDVADKSLLTNTQLAQLANKNTIAIDDFVRIFNINGNLDSIGNFEQFIFQSSNRSVVRIINGQVQIVGTGSATITITPMYGPSLGEVPSYSINVYVIYPFGETNIYNGISAETGTNSSNNPINVEEGEESEPITIIKGDVNYITIKTESNIALENTVYNFLTNSIALDVSITHQGENGTEVDYVSGGEDNKFNISGLAGQDANKFIEGTLGITVNEDVSEDTTFTFLVNILLQSGSQPFPNSSPYFIRQVNNILSGLFNEYFNFKVSVRAERLLLSIKEAEIDPSTIISVDTELHTNRDEDRVKVMIKDEAGNIVWASESVVEDSDGNIRFVTAEDYENGTLISGLVYVFEKGATSSIFEVNGAGLWEDNSTNYNGNITIANGVLSGNVLISVREDARKTIDTTKTYTVVLTDSNEDVSNSFNFVLKPQQIVNVTYTHHNRTDDSTESGIKIQDEPSSVLVPGDNGILTIGLYPTYGSYSRIVLESQIIDNNYYVLMEQMYKSGDFYLSTSTTVGYNSERDVNRLTIYKPSDSNLNTGYIYVRTRILESVNQGLYFPITITIYDKDENGEEYVVKSETITLVSQVIDGAEITIDGEKDATVVRGYTYPIQISVEESQSLADYNLVDFDTTGDADDSVTVYFNRSEYEIVDGRKIYNGTVSIGLDAELNGDGVFKIETIVQKIVNGRIESTTDSIELRVVDFLIESVQIKGNAEGDNVFNTPAAIEKDLSFEFILTETPEIFSSSQQDSINRINNAKEEFLNSLAYKQYVTTDDKIYQYIVNTDRIFGVNSAYETDKSQPSHISTSQMSIIYDLYYAGDLTALVNGTTVQENEYFSFAYDGDSNRTSGLGARTIRVIGKRMGAINLTLRIGYQLPGVAEVQYFNYNFTINVQMYSDEDKPTPIETEEQFIEYLSSTSDQYGETNFILMNDLVLENFVPFTTTNFASLDGNNKVITIKNFDLSSQTTGGLNIGLFQTVSEGSTLKNLVVNYNETEGIFVDESLYSSVNFGGIAVTNNGVIYNCEVVSIDMSSNNMVTDDGGIEIYFSQTNKDAPKLDSTTVQIAGLVVTNSATGSITNSRVGGKGGFTKVVYNEGTGASEINYDYSRINLIGQGNMAGFVITNNGTISASYFANGFITNKTISGAQCATAGFAITNSLSSTITGCYAEGFRLSSDGLDQFITGGGITSQGVAAGFIYENAGTISDCYSNIKLAGDSTGRLVSGFVYSNATTGTIARCYSASTIVGELTTQMPFTGKDARENSLQLNPEGIINSYYLVKRYDTETVLEEKYNTGATALQASTLNSSTFYGFAMAWEDDENNGIWIWNETYKYPELVSANQVAISVRRVIENYSSLITGGTSTESLDIFPYIQGYEYGSVINPIIIRTADEFNRVFGQETNLVENAYYAISQMYDKDLGIVFGSYRLVSSVNFEELTTIENIRISSSIMNLAQNNSYFGTFDGNGLVIRNVEIALDSQSSVGLFSMITSGGVFKNATITVVTVAGGQRSVYAGAVAGLVQNSSVSNVTVQPVTTSGDNRSRVSGQNIVGGVVGAVVGNSKVSNLVSNISVVSGNANGLTDAQYYYENILRSSSIIQNGVIIDQNSNYSFAGGVIGVLDIYQDINDNMVTFSDPNAIRLQYAGQNISIQGGFVGGVVGFVGPSTYLADASFVLTGQQDQLNQRLITYGNTIGGVVGVNYGELYELKIEHSTELQLAIEDNMEGYYNSASTSIFRGNSRLFNSTTSSLVAIGGLVGQMMDGELTVSYSKVDVSASASSYSGGVIGINNASTDFYEIYSFGDVSGKKAGGLIGLNNAEITLDKCVAFTYYSKENAGLNEIINVAQDFNSGNLTFAGANITTGESYSGRLQFTTGSNKTILVEFAAQPQSQNANASYLTINIDASNIIKQWNVNGYNFYTYSNGTNEYGLIRERLYNSDFTYGYYYTNQENNKVTVLWETEDGQFYFSTGREPDLNADGVAPIEFSGSQSYVSFTNINYVDLTVTDAEDKDDYDTVDSLTSTGNDKVVTYASFEMTQLQITEIQLKKLTIGAIFGENGDEGNVLITNASQESVYGNLEFDYNGFTIKLWNSGLVNSGATNNLLGLTVNLSNYQGYEIDGQTINKMFFGSEWRPNLWELRDGFIFPTFNYEISSNTLYIEKPLDLLKLNDYNKADNVVIFGDDPATVFNPYDYEAGNVSTYGEFTAAELVGLSKGQNGELIYDISVIRGNLSVNYSDYYFSSFMGTMYGESDETPVLTNIDKALFNLIYGGEISNLVFDNDVSRETTSMGAVLANSIEGQTTLENLTFQDITIETQREQIGAIANNMANVFEISNVEIRNVTITSTNTNKDANLSIGAIAGANAPASGTVSASIALSNVSVSKLTIEAQTNALLTSVGGLFGKVGYGTTYENVNVLRITINVVLRGNVQSTIEIFAGGFVGDASGTTATFGSNTVESGGAYSLAQEIVINLGKAAVTYAGGIFGYIGTINANNGELTIKDINISSVTENDDSETISSMIVGGFAGHVSTSGNLTNVEIDFGKDTEGENEEIKTTNGSIDLNTDVFDSTSSIPSSVGGVFGEATSGTLSNVSVSNVGINLTNKGANSSYITIFGGLVGEVKTLTISGNSSFTGTITIDGNAGKFYGGGIVGSATGTTSGGIVGSATGTTNSLNIGNQEGVNNDIVSNATINFNNTASGSTYYVGGVLGTGTTDSTDSTDTVYTISNSTNNGNISFNGAEVNGNVSFEGANITVGGIAGANIKNGTLSNNKSYGDIKIGNPEVATTISSLTNSTTIVAGGIAGGMTNGGTVSGNWVGGDIIVGSSTENSPLTGLTFTAGGVVGSMTGTGEISNNYAWGNIELSKNAELFNNENDYAIAELNVGGVVGSVSGTLTFTGNNSLTSIYIVQRAQTHNVYAMIGDKDDEDITATENSKQTNYYTHQITLATELTNIATNVYYNRNSGMLSKFNTVINNENLPADQKTGGSKLSPTTWTGGDLATDTYYVMTSGKTLSSTVSSLNGHLVGDGYMINSSATPFTSVNGYVSGILFGIASTSEGTGAGGRVSGSTDSLPNGVATTNNGIIFAVNVSATGYYNVSLTQGNVRYSILSGIANTNNGLISDSGVVLNVKDAYAGVSGSNSGVIANTYVTGAVHEGANWSFAGGSDGGIYNSYAAIKVQSAVESIYQTSGLIVEGEKVENFFYDRFATETASVADSEEEKTTDDMSTVDGTETDILENDDAKKLLGENWTQSTSYNFGYPYLGGGAYVEFGYMATCIGDVTFSQTGVVDGTVSGSTGDYDVYRYNIFGQNLYLVYRLAHGFYYSLEKPSGYITSSMTGIGLGERSFSINVGGVDYTIYLSGMSDSSITYSCSNSVDSSNSYVPNPGKLAQALATNNDIYLLADMDISIFSSPLSVGNVALIVLEGVALSWQGQDYSATLDGNNYQIFNLPNTTGGFVKELTGTIQNVAINYASKSNVTGANVGGFDRAGGVAAVNRGTIDNVSSSGATVSATNDAGGLVGYNSGVITETGSISSSGSITHSANYNIVSGDNNAGGIVGFVDNGTSTISNNSNYGTVEGTRVGGIAGELGAKSTANISYGYNYGAITGISGAGDQAAGGIVGLISNSSSNVENSYNSASVGGTVNAGGIVGLVAKKAGTKPFGENKYYMLTEVNSSGVYSLGNSEHWDDWEHPEANKTMNGIDPSATNGNRGDSTVFSDLENRYKDGNYSLVFRVYIEGNNTIEAMSINGYYNGYYTDDYYVKASFSDDGTCTLKAIFGNYYVEFSCKRSNNKRWLHDFDITITDVTSNVNIFDNINEGAVSVSGGSSYAGGIVGRTMQNVSVSTSKNSGNVKNSATTGTNFAGGIIGGTYPGGASNIGKVENCLNTGAITANGGEGWAHGIGNDLATILNSRNDGAISGSSGATDGDSGTLDEDRLPSFQSSNNWSSHVDEAVSGGSMGKGDYYYDSTNKTYYVYTGLGLAYVANEEGSVDSEAKVNLMNNIDLSDYNVVYGIFIINLAIIMQHTTLNDYIIIQEPINSLF